MDERAAAGGPADGPADGPAGGAGGTAEGSEVGFDSGADRVAGWLFRPAGAAGDVPCVVLGHGFTGTADRLLPVAREYAAAGFAALAFDYRNFGRSGGRPRQTISLSGQREDFRNAVAYARGAEGIDPDRIVLWGSSLGGGHVIAVAADDPRIAAVVSQVPFNGFPRKVEGRSTGDTLRLLGAMVRDQLRSLLGRPPYYIPAVGNTGELAVMAGDEAASTVRAMSGQGSLWRNRVAPGVLLDMMRYRPGDRAGELRMPVLLCLAEYDRATLAEHTLRIAERAERCEVVRYPVRHVDIYRPDIRARVVADQIAFLRRHLASG
jgi:hypothetical protein